MVIMVVHNRNRFYNIFSMYNNVPGDIATIWLKLRRSVQGSLLYSTNSVAVYPEGSEGSHSCTFSNPIQQIKKWQKKLSLALVVVSIQLIV